MHAYASRARGTGWSWLFGLLACGAGPACGPGESPSDAGEGAANALLRAVHIEGLTFHPVDTSAGAAAATRVCATWLSASGLGTLQGPILQSNENHLLAVTNAHVVMLGPQTCVRREPVAVLADKVQDAARVAALV